MIKRQPREDADQVKVTFVLPLSNCAQSVSVLGDFNGWDPLAHPLKRRSNGTRSVTVEVATGSDYQFKYLSAEGTWFCDPDADDSTRNEYDEVNSILRT